VRDAAVGTVGDVGSCPAVLSRQLGLLSWTTREVTMKTVSGFVVALIAVGLLFGTGPVQAAVSKSQTMHQQRYAAAQHRTAHHQVAAANQCLAKPGTMRALFCPSTTPSAGVP
jgi:hypothetical protein